MFRDSLRLLYHGSNASSPIGTNKPSVVTLLQDFDSPGVFPASARIDRNLKITNGFTMKFWDAWKYPVFAFNRASSLALDVISHHVWGPRRKSWGIEMTILSSIMRDVSRHSALADITMVRKAMGIGGLVPLPSDALVTPVTFCVRKRNLRGLLETVDAMEDEKRELSGEWIIGKRLWQSLQSDYKSTRKAGDGANLVDQTKFDYDLRIGQSRVIFYIHGGAYYSSSAAAQRMLTIPLSKYTNARIFAVDYRLAPETVFPGQLHDVVSTYFRLTDDLRVPPENLVVAGDSAGGALGLALLLYLRDNGYTLPGGAMLFSPWVDLTLSCESWDTNAPYDIIPTPGPTGHLHPVVMYLGDGLEQYITHPYASPLFGKLDGLPPMLIQCGDAEVLHDEIVLLSHKASLAGVQVQLETYQDAVHVFQAFPFLNVATTAFISCREFVRYKLPRIQSHMPHAFGSDTETFLGSEINDNLRVVSGDGVETNSGWQEVQEQMAREILDTSYEERLSPTVPPSWGRTWLDLAPTPDFSGSEAEPTTPCVTAADPSRVLRHAASTPALRRMQSALSVFAERSVASQYLEDWPTRRKKFTLSPTPTRPSSPSESSHPSINSPAFATSWAAMTSVASTTYLV
ncbi:Alpha/Beta hydrolase protein [Suillus clintonianus]|uniref:Alpha/Beta hydrolase protein n=1 Tax=Suillus clintonianus TaxID=1904413 RepID=UPI001B87843A|nr:Alpha/Beta hydrolase protein [Suillus clintonianus]KAG2154560.1 Alpha/Beta hydrolase protein [Suillus clintonianus]